MKKLLGNLLVLSLVLLSAGVTFGQQEIFRRSAVIPPPYNENGGYGNAVVGYDVTGSGAGQIYAVNDDWTDSGAELIPKIYEFKYDGTKWDSVWSAVLNVPRQNTWPALAVADLDGDGKKEVIWGPVNNLGDDNPNPPRIVVYEAQGGGSDNLGVADGSGGFKPNAEFTITDSSKLEIRPFKWVVADVNNDGKPEIIFADRRGNMRFGVVSVDNIPDNGDSAAAHWSLLASGLGDTTMSTSTLYDMAVMDSTIYLIHSNGTVTPVFYANGSFTIGPDQADVVPGGSWKSAETVDMAGDGHKEIVVGQWIGGSKVYMLQPSGDTLATTVIGDFGVFGSNRLNGGATGDLDGDGHPDFVFGSRTGYSTTNADIYRLSYRGGDITSPSSYQESVIDSLIFKSGGQYDVVAVGNVDGDASTDEVVYSATPRSSAPVPLVVLNRMTVDSLSSIADVRVDANADGVPDNLNSTFKVMGTVNSVNWGASSNYFSYTIQDGSAGIDLYKYGSGPGPMFHVGDRVIATGKVSQYNGVDELTLNDTSDVSIVDTGRVILPQSVTLEDLNKNGEKYESMVVKVDAIAPSPSNSTTWPAAGKNAGITVWDGYSSLEMYIDKDTEIDGMTEPTYPINLTGVVGQYSTATPPLGGYEIEPVVYGDIEQNVAAAPNAHFYFTDSLHALAQSALQLKDSTTNYYVVWHPAVDLNGDALIYQIHGDMDGNTIFTGGSDNGGKDTMYTLSTPDILTAMAGKDSITVDFTVAVKSVGTTEPIVWSVDTLRVMIVNAIVTDVKTEGVPTSFFVDQNYPNPFNPTTTIKFGLRQENKVDLRVYDILGRQVAVLIDNQNMRSGVHEVQFNASQLASGTYIYRLQSGSNTVIKKMVLLK